MACAAEEHSSVAPKLLHDMQSNSLTGMRLVKHLQVGCLMGCLTHLSLAGHEDVKDDPGWGRDTLLTSQYSALFLANPFLEYIDLSRTGLTNTGLFYLILELAYCDPSVLPPCGHKYLKQVVLGPPIKSSGIPRCQHPEPFMQTALAPLHDLYLGTPFLELVCLIHPGAPAVSPISDTEQVMFCATWVGLDKNNQVANSLFQGKPCSVLRTRKGANVQVHTHQHRAKFSEKLLPGTWIAQNMKEAEEESGVLDEPPDDTPSAQAQRQRTMPSSPRGANALQQQSRDGAAGSDGAAGVGAAGEPGQHDFRLPDLPPYHIGGATSTGVNGGGHQSRLLCQADAGGNGDSRQPSRQGHRRDSAGGAKRASRPRTDGATQRKLHRPQHEGSGHRTHRATAGAPVARRGRSPGAGNAARQRHAVARSHQRGARAQSERPARPMQLHSRHAGTRPQAPTRPRPRNEEVEARQMHKQLWRVQLSPARAPRARTGCEGGAKRPRAHTGNRVKVRRAGAAAGNTDTHHGRGDIINLSDDGSQSDDNPHSAPAARVARSCSPNLHSPPLHYDSDAGVQRPVSMSHLGHSLDHSDGYKEDMEEAGDRVRSRASHSSGSPSPTRLSRLPGRQSDAQQPAGPAAAPSDRFQQAPRRCRSLSDIHRSSCGQPTSLRSASDMSGAPEDDGEQSQDGDEPACKSVSPEVCKKTGAKRRRRLRYQKERQLAINDPELCSRIQRERALTMPFASKKLHPSFATLDPPAFEVDEPAAVPQQPASYRQPEHTVPGHAARRDQGGDISSDDFDPGNMQISRPPVAVNRQSCSPPQVDGAPAVPAADALPSDPPCASLRPPSLLLPPASEPAEACLPDVSVVQSRAHASTTSNQDVLDADVHHGAIELIHSEVAVAAEGMHAEADAAVDMEVHAPPPTSASPHEAGQTVHAVEHITHVHAPTVERPPDMQRADAHESHVAPKRSGRDAAALSQEAATHGSIPHCLPLSCSPAQAGVVVSQPVKKSASASENAMVDCSPHVSIDDAAMTEAAVVSASGVVSSGVDCEIGAGKLPGQQNQASTCQCTNPPHTTAPPVSNTDGVQAECSPDVHHLARITSTEDCTGNPSMLGLLQTEREQGTPTRSNVQPTTDMPGAVKHMGTPGWLKEGTQHAAGIFISNTPMVAAGAAPGDAAAADVGMAPSPPPHLQPEERAEPQCCGSDLPPTADLQPIADSKPPCASETLVPCSAGIHSQQRDLGAAPTQSLYSTDNPVRHDTIAACVLEAPRLGPVPVEQQAAASLSSGIETRERSKPCAEFSGMEGDKDGRPDKGDESACAKNPASKGKVNKEVERLTLYHWDKPIGSQPMGKRPAWITEQQGGVRRTRRCTYSDKSGRQQQPASAQQAAPAKGAQNGADELRTSQQETSVPAHSKGHGEDTTDNHQDSTDKEPASSSPHTAPVVEDITHVGSLDTVRSMQSPDGAVAHAAEKAPSSLSVKKRKSRLSRIPRT